MTFARHNLRNLALFFLTRPWSRASRVVSAWQSWAPHAPDNLWSNMHLSAAFGGPPSLSVGGSYVGSLAGLNAQLDKLYHLVGTRAVLRFGGAELLPRSDADRSRLFHRAGTGLRYAA